MIRLREHILAAGLALATGSVTAQDLSAQFPATWSEYLIFCGTVLNDPGNAAGALPKLSNLPQKVLQISADQATVSGEYFSVDTQQSRYIYLAQHSQGYWLECEVSSSFIAPGSAETTGPAVKAMLGQSGQMRVLGGDSRDVAGSTQRPADIGHTRWHNIAVEGAFLGRNLITIVDVHDEGFDIRLSGNLP